MTRVSKFFALTNLHAQKPAPASESRASIPIGAPVCGTFSYDLAMISVDSFGDRWTCISDPAVSFSVDINGQFSSTYTALLWGLTFLLDLNGLPMNGYSQGSWDLWLNNGTPNLTYSMAGNYINAQIADSVPEAGATGPLLGIALTSLAAGPGATGARRCNRDFTPSLLLGTSLSRHFTHLAVPISVTPFLSNEWFLQLICPPSVIRQIRSQSGA